jgi:hypothetical protein
MLNIFSSLPGRLCRKNGFPLLTNKLTIKTTKKIGNRMTRPNSAAKKSIIGFTILL